MNDDPRQAVENLARDWDALVTVASKRRLLDERDTVNQEIGPHGAACITRAADPSRRRDCLALMFAHSGELLVYSARSRWRPEVIA
jgi:hypothetical protein